MIARDGRMRQIGWMAILAVCAALFIGLTFRVNAVKSQVHLAERRIIQLENSKMMLETEFETRANQQQLADWNEVDFGYQAPRAGQYLESERQLAQFGTPRAPGAPEPIRVARAPTPADDDSILPAFVSPLTGKAVAAELPRGPVARRAASAAAASTVTDLAERLGRHDTMLAEAGE